MPEKSLSDPRLFWKPEGRQWFDIHKVFSHETGKPVNDAVAVAGVVGAAKLLERFSSIMTDRDITYLRCEKPYLGEATLIKFSAPIIDNDGQERLKYMEKQIFWRRDVPHMH